MLHNMTITSDDENRMIITGVLYPDVQAGAGPAHQTIQADPNDREAYYNDPAVKVNEQDLENWNYLRGKPMMFEHGHHQETPIIMGQWLDSCVNKNGDLYVVGEINKRKPEGEWLAQKVKSRDLGDLSIGYNVKPWTGTNKIRTKEFLEGSVVDRGYLKRTQIGIACSNAGDYKSSDIAALNTSGKLIGDYDIILMASHSPPSTEGSAPPSGSNDLAQAAPSSQTAQGVQAPATTADASKEQSKVSSKGVNHHAQEQFRDTNGRFQKDPVVEHTSSKDALSNANQLELETRIQKQRAEFDAQAAELKKLRDTSKAENNEYARLKKEDNARKAAIREEKQKAMEDALTKIRTGLQLDEMKDLSNISKAVAVENNPGAVKASNTLLAIGQKVSEMNGKLGQVEKTVVEKDAEIAQLMEQLEAAKKGHNVIASRVNQARQNLRNTNRQPATMSDKGKEEEEEDDATSMPVQASSYGGHGSDIGDIMVPLPAVQHGTWEARFVQDQYNPNFGQAGISSYGVNASAGVGKREVNEYDNRSYAPVGDHAHSHYTGNGMKDQGPEGRAWFTHLVRHTDQLEHLPRCEKYGLDIGERHIECSYDAHF